MEVILLKYTPLEIAIKAIRTCYNSNDRSDNLGERDLNLIKTIIKNGHTSTLEHLVFTFEIKDISRALLQELARHRMASLSVKSTRYTLKELKDEEGFHCQLDKTRAEKYIVFSKDEELSMIQLNSLELLRQQIVLGKTNDTVKYILPECYKTSLIYTINARSLRNLIKLRTSHRALPEFQELANKMYNLVPNILVGDLKDDS